MQKIICLIGTTLISTFSVAQSFIVSGKITGENDAPLVGASVYNAQSLAGTVTDAQGVYKLKVKAGSIPLKVEFLGYKTQVDTLEVESPFQYDVQLSLSPLMSKEFVVEATRAGETTPMAFENLSKEFIEQNNLAQDLPILLNQAVSAVTTSDAGAGVGYTGLRIRGSDATRINVTINGVPVNDAESHGVFWVNMPDFASSTENIQIQRGVGTSSNGAAAFGASINLETSTIDTVSYVEINNSYGSFNTRRHNAIFNSGLINDHFHFEGRLSYIGSDGYIDRSASDLRSYYLSGAYYGEKMMVKAMTFSGKEVTQQAWWGTPESRINGDETAMLEHAINNGLSESQTENLLTSGRTYNYYEYDNEIDNYGQDHYQLITGWQLGDHLKLNLTGHYTYGRGYFEQFKANDDLADFGLDNPVIGNDTVSTADIIVRRWLENHFYGGVYSLQYKKGRNRLTLGGSANEYIGDHFGEVIWAGLAPNNDIRDRYYESTSQKLDVSNYLKWELTLSQWRIYTDVQARLIDYQALGVDNDQRPIDVNEEYFFINPKAGVSYHINSQQSLFASISRASREPVRNDFIDAVPGVVPNPEYLTDIELGWNQRFNLFSSSVNAYYMHYTDQLVLTGEVNDVGAPVRANVNSSYRAGVEASLKIQLENGIYWQPNLTLSQNKIASFTELIYDYTEGFDVVEVEHQNTDIAFSPNIIAGSQLGYKMPFGLEVALMTKYVGKQYLDNTSDENKTISPYFVNDFRITYEPKIKALKRVQFSLLINNLLNEMYESNGYTYSYIYGSMITENFYYPQAGTNFLAGLKLRF
ncbi:MAG: TonB-dependent receptor [Salibacteraceae bacterium]